MTLAAAFIELNHMVLQMYMGLLLLSATLLFLSAIQALCSSQMFAAAFVELNHTVRHWLCSPDLSTL